MKKKIEQSVLPVLPLRDMVIFPGAISPVFAGRPMSLAALDAAKVTDTIFVLTQKEPGTNKPVENDLYTVGVVAKVLQRIALDDGTVKLLVNGLYRAKVESMTDILPFSRGVRAAAKGKKTCGGGANTKTSAAGKICA